MKRIMVTPGSDLVATDGLTKHLTDTPRGDASWIWNKPPDAAEEFVAAHPE